MIIDKSYFKGDITIAQTEQVQVEEKLNDYIQQYEPEFLLKVLGRDLSTSFNEGIDVGSGEEMEEKWSNILNGANFTYYNHPMTYKGIETDIARYVFYHYACDLHLQQTGIGTVKTKGQGSAPATPMFKVLKAWNEMANNVRMLWMLLEANAETYPTFNRSYIDKSFFRHQNQFGV